MRIPVCGISIKDKCVGFRYGRHGCHVGKEQAIGIQLIYLNAIILVLEIVILVVEDYSNHQTTDDVSVANSRILCKAHNTAKGNR